MAIVPTTSAQLASRSQPKSRLERNVSVSGEIAFQFELLQRTRERADRSRERESAKNTNTHERANWLHVRLETAAIAENFYLIDPTLVKSIFYRDTTPEEALLRNDPT